MADLLPSSPDPSAGDGGEPKVVGVDSDDADDLLAALQSETARDLLAALYDDPATPSELADEADTSIQNVRYHLERLTDADLVEVVDTVYSEKGREMKVYAPAAKPLVVFAGGDDDAPGLESALSSLLGGLGVLGLSSLAVQRLFGGPNAVGSSLTDREWQGQSVAGTTEEDPAVGLNATEEVTADAATTTPEAATTRPEATGTAAETRTEIETGTEAMRTEATRTEATGADATPTTAEEVPTGADATETVLEATRTVAEEATTTVASSGGTSGAATSGLPPGVVFFLGGLVVLLALGVAWYLRAR
ncbi:ArsR/SmtB family transcription factor [Halorussus salinus]|uniref:ArsR/SmtB family transcription factor n=1 Tax=Halorussus salinus TaxID=1364935 RepID=UPI00109230B6|nr:helix-turn-helix domain-containing protein [Halorussus salinus]